MENKFMVANTITGEVVASDMVRPLVSEVKRWVHNGMHNGAFLVLESSSKKVTRFFYELVNGLQTSKCDFCKCEVKRRDMVFHCDSEDVCLVAECKECNEGAKY